MWYKRRPARCVRRGRRPARAAWRGTGRAREHRTIHVEDDSRPRPESGAAVVAGLALVGLLVPTVVASPAQAAAPLGSVTVAAYEIANPQEIVTGSDGNLWFANTGNNSIGRVTPAGVVTAFADASLDGPTAITSGPDGNLWFTNSRGGSIGRITPAGVITNFTDPKISGATDITGGPDGSLWFTELDQQLDRAHHHRRRRHHVRRSGLHLSARHHVRTRREPLVHRNLRNRRCDRAHHARRRGDGVPGPGHPKRRSASPPDQMATCGSSTSC